MNISNKYCKLSLLSKEEVDELVALMPKGDYFDFRKCERFIGFSSTGLSGTWGDELIPRPVISYKEMLSLLGAEEKDKLVPHVHQKEIIAWANGEEIEFESWIDLKWKDKNFDSWDEDSKFRVKPKITPTQLLITEKEKELSALKFQDAVERGVEIVLGEVDASN
jgi:hypothetical protein